MYQIPPPPLNLKSRMLAVLCGQYVNTEREVRVDRPYYPFPELTSFGSLEVQTLINPTLDEFCVAYKSICPSVVFLQGQQLEDEEKIGSLVWGTEDVSDPEFLCSLFVPLPTAVYLEVPSSERTALKLYAKGVPYVIYWDKPFSSYESSHFREALFTITQSSCTHMWDAFQLAEASFRLYCVRNKYGNFRISGCAPRLLGECPKVSIPVSKKCTGEEERSLSDTNPTIIINDKDVDVRFLLCGWRCNLDACLYGPLEDGLNALMNIEIRGSKLRRIVRLDSATAPSDTGTVSQGIAKVTCDFITSSASNFSIVVSGSMKILLDAKLLESLIKKELTETCKLFKAFPKLIENYPEPSPSLSIAAGAPVFAFSMKAPSWAVEVLKYATMQQYYRSLVVLGVAWIGGVQVASFEKKDADRLLFFCRKPEENLSVQKILFKPPRFHANLTSKRSKNENGSKKAVAMAPLRPIPRFRRIRKVPLLGEGTQVEEKRNIIPPTCADDGNRVKGKMVSGSSARSQTLNTRLSLLSYAPADKHGCKRRPMNVCSEEEFISDLKGFLVHHGCTRLIPDEERFQFPKTILNRRRVDLFNLYKEVVSRGGFRLHNEMNWKGEIFLSMNNFSEDNKATGIGATIKEHYITYLFEYEKAHDDVKS